MTCHNCRTECQRFGKHRNGLQRTFSGLPVKRLPFLVFRFWALVSRPQRFVNEKRKTRNYPATSAIAPIFASSSSASSLLSDGP
jgi:hypothetical protein